MEISNLNHKKNWDKNINKISLKIGDKILITNEDGHKLDKNFFGTFKVIDIDDKNVKVIDNDTNKKIAVH